MENTEKLKIEVTNSHVKEIEKDQKEQARLDPDIQEARLKYQISSNPNHEQIADKVFEKVNEIALSKLDQYFKESEMFNQDNPRSLFSILPPGIAQCFYQAIKYNPDLFELWLERDDAKFERITSPTVTDNLLRASFWNEYYRAQNQGDKMRVRYIYESVCPKDHFFKIIRRPHRALWILTPPQDQTKQMEVLMQKGFRRLEEILNLPMVKDGKVNINVANLIMKTAIVLDVRLRGQAIQKVEVTNRHEVKMSADDIDKKLRELEKEDVEIKKICTNPAPDRGTDFFETLAVNKQHGKY